MRDKTILNTLTEGYYICHWTGLRVPESEAVWTSPIIPTVKGVYAAHYSYRDARKESLRLFKEFEANCNTCKHFKRTRNTKIFCYGECLKTGEDLKIDTNESMGMECYDDRE